MSERRPRQEDTQLGPIEVEVSRDNLNRAVSQLKKLMAREGVLKDVKNRRHYEKPSEKLKRRRREAERRRRKDLRRATMPRRRHED